MFVTETDISKEKHVTLALRIYANTNSGTQNNEYIILFAVCYNGSICCVTVV